MKGEKWGNRTLQVTPLKVTITGDDILLEYTSRLIVALRRTGDEELPRTWKKAVEGFLLSPVWRTTDPIAQPLWRRIEVKYEEMKRRKGKVKLEIRDQGKVNEVLTSFTAVQLEAYLKSATGGVARDLIQPLVGRGNSGILSVLTCSLASARSTANTQMYEEEEGEMVTVERKRSLESLSTLAAVNMKLMGRPHKVQVRRVLRK